MKIEEIKQKKTVKELLEFGIINIDKPSGPTSFSVSDFVRKSLNELGVRKTSHFGTLDPKVTGVLPIALNRACKLTGFFLGEDKEYVGIMRVHEELEIGEIKKIIEEKFTGKIIQTPPVRSRVARKPREREVKSFNILEQEGQNYLFRTEVQGGTYIRKLIDGLGRELGCGAHMLELRRTRAGIFGEAGIFFDSKKHKAGIFTEDKKYLSVNLYEFKEAIKEYKTGDEEALKKIIIPGEVIIELHPVVEIEKEAIELVLHGSPVYEKFLEKKEDFETGKIVCVFSDKRFIGVFRVLREGEIFAKSEFTMQEIK